MLTQYIQAAMGQAHYELLEDGTFYAEIPPCPGVYATSEKLEACCDELQEVLEGWIMLGIQMGHTIPPMGKASL